MALALAFLGATSPRASAQRLSVDYLISGLDPAECLARKESFAKRASGNIKKFNVGAGGGLMAPRVYLVT
jgi:hypothetical protein